MQLTCPTRHVSGLVASHLARTRRRQLRLEHFSALLTNFNLTPISHVDVCQIFTKLALTNSYACQSASHKGILKGTWIACARLPPWSSARITSHFMRKCDAPFATFIENLLRTSSRTAILRQSWESRQLKEPVSSSSGGAEDARLTWYSSPTKMPLCVCA